jgi:protein disulfide-isomerase
MKLCLLAWPFLSFALAPTLAASSSDTTVDASVQSEDLKTVAPVDLTVFNGIEVPPMKELDGDGFEESIKEGYWYVSRDSSPGYCFSH